jgi:hypothetical protein
LKHSFPKASNIFTIRPFAAPLHRSMHTIMKEAVSGALSRALSSRSFSSSIHTGDDIHRGCWVAYVGVEKNKYKEGVLGEVLKIIGQMVQVRLSGSFVEAEWIPISYLRKVPPPVAVAVGDWVVILDQHGKRGEQALVLSRHNVPGVMFDVLILSWDGSSQFRVACPSEFLRPVTISYFERENQHAPFVEAVESTHNDDSKSRRRTTGLSSFHPALEDALAEWENNLSTPRILQCMAVSSHLVKKGIYSVILTVSWRPFTGPLCWVNVGCLQNGQWVFTRSKPPRGK